MIQIKKNNLKPICALFKIISQRPKQNMWLNKKRIKCKQTIFLPNWGGDLKQVSNNILKFVFGVLESILPNFISSLTKLAFLLHTERKLLIVKWPSLTPKKKSGEKKACFWCSDVWSDFLCLPVCLYANLYLIFVHFFFFFFHSKIFVIPFTYFMSVDRFSIAIKYLNYGPKVGHISI